MNKTQLNQRGTSQGKDVFFRVVNKSNADDDKVLEIVQKYMDMVGKVTGRSYKIFEYYGAADAERVVGVKGTGLPVMEEFVDYLKNGQKVGVIAVHLHRRGALSTSLLRSKRRSRRSLP